MARRTSETAGAKKPATKKATRTAKPATAKKIRATAVKRTAKNVAEIKITAEPITDEKAKLPDEWEKQAKEIIQMAESTGLQENFFFKTTFERYLTQIKILADLQKTIESTETLIEKQYVKGRGNLYANPAIREFVHVTDSANKTVQTLIKIINGFKSSDSKEDDQLLAIINGDDDDE